MSQEYAISSRDEAKAYLEHPILGARLRECTQLLMAVEDRTAEQVFSYPDNLKFRSSLTLFEYSATEPGIFRAALLKYFGGKPDRLTLDILKSCLGDRRLVPHGGTKARRHTEFLYFSVGGVSSFVRRASTSWAATRPTYARQRAAPLALWGVHSSSTEHYVPSSARPGQADLLTVASKYPGGVAMSIRRILTLALLCLHCSRSRRW